MKLRRISMMGSVFLALLFTLALAISGRTVAQAAGTQLPATINEVRVADKLIEKDKINEFIDRQTSRKFDVLWSVNAGKAIESGDYFTLHIDKLLCPTTPNASGDVVDEADPELVIGKFQMQRNSDGSCTVTITFNDKLAGRENVRGHVWWDVDFRDNVEYGSDVDENGSRYVIHPQGLWINGNKSDENSFGVKVTEAKREEVELEKSFLDSHSEKDPKTGSYYMQWVQWAVLVDGGSINYMRDTVTEGAKLDLTPDGKLIFDIGEVVDSPDAPFDFDYKNSPSRNNLKFRKLSEAEKAAISTNLEVQDSRHFRMDLNFPKDKYYIVVYKTVADEGFAHKEKFSNDVMTTNKNRNPNYSGYNVFTPNAGAAAYGDTGYVLVKKVDTAGNPIVGAEFNLLRKLDDGSTTVLTSGRTDENGFLYFGDLRANGVTYLIEETSVPAPYVKLAEPVAVSAQKATPEIEEAHKKNDVSVLEQHSTKVVNYREGEEPPTQPGGKDPGDENEHKNPPAPEQEDPSGDPSEDPKNPPVEDNGSGDKGNRGGDKTKASRLPSAGDVLASPAALSGLVASGCGLIRASRHRK